MIDPDSLTIASKWDLLVATIIPPDASEIQRREMRRAFYAGFQAALSISLDIGDRSISEQVAVQVLDRLHAEAQEFAKAIAEGKA